MNRLSKADAQVKVVPLPQDGSGGDLLLLEKQLSNYRGLNGTYDEAVTKDGTLRDGWPKLFENLGTLSVRELERRIAQAQRQIDAEGVVFNPHDDASEISRPWKLDPVPLVIPEAEWNGVAEGLAQRAQLIDLIILDFLGPQTLLREKVVPPELLFANPQYFPAYHGLVNRPIQHVQLYAADLARDPSGQWWVTADRARSPSGLGYVLENRLIASRMLPVAFSNGNVHRLASFFMTFQRALRDLAKRYRDNPRIAIWSRGTKSKSYFEDAFLARYLGYTLVESDDLAVRNNRVMLKTLGALLPVEVLLRRLDDHRCDPSELTSGSDGISGLLEVIRSGNVAVANSLGSSYAEAPMLAAFLPAICRHLIGQDLKIPSVATWWCGQPHGLKYVQENLERVVIRSAFRDRDEAPLVPAMMTAEQREELSAKIAATPQLFVGQERITRSTTPVWDAGQLKPWSVALRAFMVAKDDGYYPLPGALARVSPDADALLQDMTSGEKSQDVWIVARESVPIVSLLSVDGQQAELKRGGSELPSRVADNLFWFGRNLERAEKIARILRITLQQATGEDATSSGLSRLPEVCSLVKQLDGDGAVEGISVKDLIQRIVRGAMDLKNPASLRNVVNLAHGSASKVRDRIAIDSYRIVTELKEQFETQIAADEDGPYELLWLLDNAVQALSAISGLASESMTRTLGWRFFDLGRRIERGAQTVKILTTLLPLQPQGLTPALEASLKICDSYMTYRGRYLAHVDLAAVLDLLVVDDSNPRSLAYQLRAISEHIDALPRSETQAGISVEQRLALSTYNSVRLCNVYEVSVPDNRGELSALHKVLSLTATRLPKLADEVSNKFLIHAGLQRHYSRGLGADGNG
ncbi:circularly permuted type 2 ATP-grasp protein [Aureliella helgolandensis]|uniref:Uncharacterized protein n=1 Tax=Aureliella helgolandensis TaxID=2527968 RepID=A0A518G0I8_9BACT|nr:circularly permuted type 2 ATP-grasp protein [Aureliella helgolandensis]QDV22122.1 hypothetical protein Q31a_04050 [Aureliella helgolandensis]